jgi:hypothetical protein
MKSPKKLLSKYRNRLDSRRGIALVIVLCAVVLVSILVLTFLARSVMSRRLSFSSAGQARSEMLSKISVDTIVGDLRNEIVAGSKTDALYTVNDIRIYQPNNNKTLVPFRVIDPLWATKPEYANLVKLSISGRSFWEGSDYASFSDIPTRSAQENNTSAASLNGRYLPAEVWNKPRLLSGESSAPSDFVTPDWVVITREGAINNAASMPSLTALSDKVETNKDFALGRYAYAIYDIGGLIDITNAGHPRDTPKDFNSKRGYLAQIDLSTLPGIDTVNNADTLMQWRNKASINNPGYVDYVNKNTSGFMAVSPGDNTFINRQDLIQYANSVSGGLSPSALPYLTTFSRELNAPSFTPDPERKKIQQNHAPYGLPYNLDDEFNPSLINTRVTKAFTRLSDNSEAKIGQPFLHRRFPLSRLALLTPTATATKNQTDAIYRSFGLFRSDISKPWQYDHGSSDRILRLDQVASAQREPDFFELLQAAIHIGSLGKSNGTTEGSVSTGIDSDDYYHILSIGANLIDQYDTDSFPTTISFNPPSDMPLFVLCGKENLPYLNRFFETPFRLSKPSGGFKQPNIGSWLQLKVWNPHAQAQTPDLSGPTEFRVVAEGETVLYVVNTGFAFDQRTLDFQNSEIHFTTSDTRTFAQPTLLTPTNGATTPDSKNDLSDETPPLIGICQGVATAPDGRIEGSASGQPERNTVYSRSITPYITFYVQYKDKEGQWLTYQILPYTKLVANTTEVNPAFVNQTPSIYNISADPRCNRFGRGIAFPYSNVGLTIRPGSGNGSAYSGESRSAYPDWSYLLDAGTGRYFMGQLSENKSGPNGSLTFYKDPDGEVRRADGAYTTGGLEGLPLATNNFGSRPYILNRPFRSVADMGYAFRDIPWKHLDFFTPESGDSALLDVFCLNEAPASGIEAGKVSLNTRQIPVLSSLIQGAILSEQGATTISKNDADRIASALIEETSDPAKGPFSNRSDLVTRASSLFTYPNDPSASEATIIKRQREAALRALCSIGNTRTWNLLIDVITQSGRYPRTAKDLNQFLVEGERHYWLHIAIDRYTGKIISQNLEPVYE